MHITYFCDSKIYHSYYLNQIGHGGPYFSGASFQNGYSLGGIFSNLAKLIMPLIKGGKLSSQFRWFTIAKIEL